MKKTYFLLFAVMFSLFSGCKKDTVNARRFIKSGVWKLTSLKVDFVSDTLIPYWKISECHPRHQDSCEALWMVSNSNYAAFEWQFNEKGNSFTLSRQDNGDDTLKIVPFSEVQCYKYSGIYEVLERKKSLMKFVSRSTMGYEGKEVEIVIEQE